MRYHKHLLVLIWKKLKVLLRAILWKTALRPRKQAHCPKDDDRQHRALVGTKGWCWPGAFAAIALRPGTVFRGSLIGSRRVVIDVYHSCFFFATDICVITFVSWWPSHGRAVCDVDWWCWEEPQPGSSQSVEPVHLEQHRDGMYTLYGMHVHLYNSLLTCVYAYIYIFTHTKH